MLDPFRRRISYLRVSVTDRCDLRCVYCMAEDMTFLPKRELLTLEELERLCGAFIDLGVERIRLTGGEPLVRRGVMQLFGRSAAGSAREAGPASGADGDHQRHAADEDGGRLFRAGVRRINVSMDTLDPATFTAVTRWGKLDQTLEGIFAAKAAGLAVKINAVALKGVNEDEYDRLIAWCGEHGFDLTLIETMPMGDIGGDRTDQYLPLSLVRAAARRALDPGAERAPHRRPGALRHGRRDRAAPRLHHPDDPQFLRKLQPRAADLHGHPLHVPRPGGRGRPSRPTSRPGGRRCGLARRDPRGHRAQAEGA